MIHILSIHSLKYGFCKLIVSCNLSTEEKIFTFLIKERDLLELSIYKPQKISCEIFDKLKYISLLSTTEYKVFEFVSKKPRTLLEVKKFLSINDDNIPKHKEQIINNLKKYRYLNDDEYLSQLVNYYIYNHYGPGKIKYKLRDKFPRNMLEEYIEMIYTFSKIEENLLIIFNNMRKNQYFSVKEFKSKFINKCTNKGFYLEDINKFLNNIDIKIDIDIKNIYLIANKYLNKLSSKNFSEEQKKYKLKKYLLTKNISFEEINKIFDML